jgi:hypothetical protein
MRGPRCGFWLIVAAGRAEADSRLPVSGSGWAGSGCGDWVCGDLGKSAGGGDTEGWRGSLRPRSERGKTWTRIPIERQDKLVQD